MSAANKQYDVPTQIELHEDMILSTGATPFVCNSGGEWVKCSAALFAHLAHAVKIGNSRAKDIGLMLKFKRDE
jgi:hypothetical protein